MTGLPESPRFICSSPFQWWRSVRPDRHAGAIARTGDLLPIPHKAERPQDDDGPLAPLKEPERSDGRSRRSPPCVHLLAPDARVTFPDRNVGRGCLDGFIIAALSGDDEPAIFGAKIS